MPECAGCYAETWAHRMGYQVWGKDANRRILSEDYWQKPLKWNQKAMKLGMNQRIFCGSMCDWLEDHPIVNAERQKLFPLIEQTPFLTWLLLSKRIQNFQRFIFQDWWKNGLPMNIWLGISAGMQKTWDENWPILEMIKRRFWQMAFISIEPMIGSIDIRDDLVTIDYGVGINSDWSQKPDLLIIGGESEQPKWKARLLELQWVYDLIDQVHESGIKIFIKQLGSAWAKKTGIYDIDSKGDNWDYWPAGLRIREMPEEVTII
jgi:protein gp37